MFSYVYSSQWTYRIELIEYKYTTEHHSIQQWVYLDVSLGLVYIIHSISSGDNYQPLKPRVQLVFSWLKAMLLSIEDDKRVRESVLYTEQSQ